MEGRGGDDHLDAPAGRAPRLIAWTGEALGLRAIHVYRLEAHGPGTFVSTAESWEGPVARVFRRRMQETLSKAIEAGLGT